MFVSSTINLIVNKISAGLVSDICPLMFWSLDWEKCLKLCSLSRLDGMLAPSSIRLHCWTPIPMRASSQMNCRAFAKLSSIISQQKILGSTKIGIDDDNRGLPNDAEWQQHLGAKIDHSVYGSLVIPVIFRRQLLLARRRLARVFQHVPF